MAKNRSVKPRPEHSRSTRRLYQRIGVVFDFDDTLAPDSISSFLDAHGVDGDRFWEKQVQPRIKNGWDPMPAVFYALVRESFSRAADDRFTKDRLAEHGRNLKLFPGVPETLDRLSRHVKKIDPRIDLQFYILSAGVGEIIRNIPIARHFRAICASEFHYSESGEIEFVKQVISHTEKTRYLYNIATDIQLEKTVGGPFALAPNLTDRDLYLPLSQMIYCGDGLTDIPCFSIINREQGVALGLYKQRTARKWGPKSGLKRGQRVSNLAPVDFQSNSELSRSLKLAVERVCKTIQLREHSVGE